MAKKILLIILIIGIIQCSACAFQSPFDKKEGKKNSVEDSLNQSDKDDNMIDENVTEESENDGLEVEHPEEWDLSDSTDEMIIAYPSGNPIEGIFYVFLDEQSITPNSDLAEELGERGYSYIGDVGLKDHSIDNYKTRIINTDSNGTILRQRYTKEESDGQELWYYEEYVIPVSYNSNAGYLLVGYCYEESAGDIYKNEFYNTFIPGITVYGTQHVSITKAGSDSDSEVDQETNNDLSPDTDPMNMRMGDIYDDDLLYIGLSYAKVSDHVTTVFDDPISVAPDRQALVVFFDVYNGSEELRTIDERSFSCYVDGILCTRVNSDFYVMQDGITDQFPSEVYSTTNKMVLAHFDIPKEWDEIKLFYNSSYNWTLTKNDISTKPFEFHSMYDINHLEATQEKSVIYDDEYEVRYDGYDYISWDNEKYLITKFTVTNTGMTELDYSSICQEMRCYPDNYVTYRPEFLFDDKVDGYVNAFNIDTIQAGMTAKLYFAFEIDTEHDYYRIIYKTGSFYDEEYTNVCIQK